MNLWKSLLKHREFDAAVDHVAVAQIMKAKTEPATTSIMRLGQIICLQFQSILCQG